VWPPRPRPTVSMTVLVAEACSRRGSAEDRGYIGTRCSLDDVTVAVSVDPTGREAWAARAGRRACIWYLFGARLVPSRTLLECQKIECPSRRTA
jgi:hypothetical protein